MAPDRTANRYNPIGSGGGYGGGYGGGGTGAGYTNHTGGQSSFYSFSTPSFSGGNYTSFSGMSSTSGNGSYSRYWGRSVCMFWVTETGYLQELKRIHNAINLFQLIFVDEKKSTQSYLLPWLKVIIKKFSVILFSTKTMIL